MAFGVALMGYFVWNFDNGEYIPARVRIETKALRVNIDIDYYASKIALNYGLKC